MSGIKISSPISPQMLDEEKRSSSQPLSLLGSEVVDNRSKLLLRLFGSEGTRWWTGAGGVAVIALAVQVLMVIWAVQHSLIYGYGDALSHMTVARRLWDAPNPGLSQLGTNWLPLPHLVFSIPAMWTWAWRTGLGGSAASVGCAVVTAVSIYRIAERSGVGPAGGWVAALAVAANPSWSYLSAVPMTEPFVVAMTCLATAGIMGWATSKRPYSGGLTALFCGAPTAAAVMSRYEAWGFAVLAGAAFTWVAWRRFGWGGYMRRQILAFVALPALAVIWWLVFNWALFGDAFAFMSGPYSSRAFMANFDRLGLLPGKGHLTVALALYGRTVLELAGTVMVILAFAGLAVTVMHWQGLRKEMWLALVGLGVFSVFAIWHGDVTIELPQAGSSRIFNTRMGIEFLPFLAVAAAQLLRLRRWMPEGRRKIWGKVLAVGLIASLTGGWVSGVFRGEIPGGVLTVREAEADMQAGGYQRQAARWLHANALTGVILVDDRTFGVLPIIGFDLHRVLGTFSGSAWKAALANPMRVTWAVVQPGNTSDKVWTTLRSDGVLNTAFLPVEAFGPFVIYKQESLNSLPADTILGPSKVSGA